LPSPVSVRYRPVGCVRRGTAVAYRSGPRRKVVALSFDDGPWPDTPAFVRMLEVQRVPATFFMIGDQVTASYRATLRRELRDGDALTPIVTAFERPGQIVDIEGKVCIVTGASSGIGAATARLLSGLGAQVVLAARRVERLRELAVELPGSLAVPTDVTVPEKIQRLVAQALERYGRGALLARQAPST
jgi:short chain dehydrogenase/Polysaccharide deacetylase